MPRASANGIELEYDIHGPSGGRPLVMIMGLGAQMIFWPDGLVDLLATRGHRVVRFDNRDSGLSTTFTGAPVDLNTVLMAGFSGVPAPVDAAPYTLDDMANDTAGLMDALGWDSAHVVGASMGGMIAQSLAIGHPARVRSLTSIMSTPEYVMPEPDMVSMLATPIPPGREEAVEAGLAIYRKLAALGYPPSDEEMVEARRLMELAYERGRDPDATFRQLAAILVSAGRTQALGALRVPALVIHGSGDRLIPPVGGEMTAAAIPGAKHVVIEGMGHNLPAVAWPRIVDSITALTERADEAGERRAHGRVAAEA
jgi:pimeloyl-ACP methyl ester carboxylesterase